MPIMDTERRRLFNRDWYARRRNEFFKDKVCAWCGSTERMELHHLDKATKEGHCIWSWVKERREAEIAKCIVLCLHCHRGFHARERRKSLEHGTYNAYYSHRCRCAVCRRGNTDRARVYSARRKQRSAADLNFPNE
jgi:hypothetical protein